MTSWMFMAGLGVLQIGAAAFVLWEGKSPYLAGVYVMYAVSNFLMIGVSR